MKILKTILSFPLFYLSYIGLYFIGDLVCSWLFTEIKSSYWLVIPPTVFCFAYLFTLLHACIIKWSQMNRYAYIISQVLLIAWFVYRKYLSYIYYYQHEAELYPEEINSLIFNTEMILSVMAIILTFCVSFFWGFMVPNTVVSNGITKQKVAMYILGGILVVATICCAILIIIKVYDPSSFWTKLLSIIMLIAFWIELGAGAIYLLVAMYGAIMKKLLNAGVSNVE